MEYINENGERAFTDRLVDYTVEKYYEYGVKQQDWEELTPERIELLREQVYNDFLNYKNNSQGQSRNYVSYEGDQ